MTTRNKIGRAIARGDDDKAEATAVHFLRESQDTCNQWAPADAAERFLPA